MIVDTFPLGYGPEVFLLRLRTLRDVVDVHVITEGDVTHSGRKRELLWPELRQRPEFEEFVNKVVFNPVEIPQGLRPVQREEFLRDATLSAALRVLGDELGYIILGDADEIPHPYAVRSASRITGQCMILPTRYHEWYLDWRTVGGPYLWEFRQPLMFDSDGIVNGVHIGSEIRERRGISAARPSLTSQYVGWHFTLQGGPEAVREKLKAFAHTELSRMSRTEIIKRMTGMKDILDRAGLETVGRGELPLEVYRDLSRFWHMLSPDMQHYLTENELIYDV